MADVIAISEGYHKDKVKEVLRQLEITEYQYQELVKRLKNGCN